jgi:hypothetical protein
MAARCPMRGNYISSAILDLSWIYGTYLKMESPKKFSQYFLSKLSFYKLSCVSVDLFMS